MSWVLLASSPQDGIRDASTWVLKTPLGNTRRPLCALVENYARSSASVYERARAHVREKEKSSRVREKKKVSWLDNRKDKRGMTGISEVYWRKESKDISRSLFFSLFRNCSVLHASARGRVPDFNP